MPNSAPPPPPTPPSLTPTHFPCPSPSPSQKRLLAIPKPKQVPLRQNSAPFHLPQNDKKTRDLPNLSDCHGCGLRIDYSNPKQRLQPLDSFWRIVLLCRKCIKQVTSGQMCLYCFKDIANPSSDCFDCRDCDRLIHKDCVSKFGNSTPWSYCRRELGFSVCIDCWVPELLKNSIRVRNKKKNENDDSRSLGKTQNGDRSLQETVKDAHRSLEKKVAVAAKAKEKALKKAADAKNAVELASNALDLAVKKDGSGKTISEALVRNASHKGNGVSDVTRVVDDAELAFQLHRAMNSSPRISKNACSVNSSCLDVLKKTGSSGISLKWMDSGSHDGGKEGFCINSKLHEGQERSISETSAYVELKVGSALISSRLKPVLKTYSRNKLKRNQCFKNGEVGDTMSVGVVKPVLKTYRRNNLKRKECLENGEIGDVITSAVVKPAPRTYMRNILKRRECLGNGEVGYVGTCSIKDDNRIVSEPQCFLQDEVKMELPVDSAWNFSPQQSDGDIVEQEGSANARPEQCLFEYSKRIRGSSQGLQTDAFSYCIAFNNENQASAPRLAYCSAECSGLSDASLHSCVVNLQGCASVVGSSQEGI